VREWLDRVLLRTVQETKCYAPNYMEQSPPLESGSRLPILVCNPTVDCSVNSSQIPNSTLS
jgi:hypothetical protein